MRRYGRNGSKWFRRGSNRGVRAAAGGRGRRMHRLPQSGGGSEKDEGGTVWEGPLHAIVCGYQYDRSPLFKRDYYGGP